MALYRFYYLFFAFSIVFGTERDEIEKLPPIDTTGLIPTDQPLQVEDVVPRQGPYVLAPGVSPEGRPFSLNDALVYTFNNQINLQLANLNVEIQKGVLQQNAGPFDYYMDSSGGYIDQRNVQDSPDKSSQAGNTATASASINKLTRPGTSFSLNLTTEKVNSPFNTPFTDNEGSLTFTVQQPLLKGFLQGTNWMQEKSSLYTLYAGYFADFQTISQNMYNTAIAYWAAVGAQKALAIQEEGLRRVVKLTADIQELVRNGLLAEGDILQPEYQELLQANAVLAAEQTLYQAIQQLCVVMGNVSVSDLGDTPLVLTTAFPTFALDPKAFQAQFEKYLNAIYFRYDIQAARLLQRSAQYLVKGARNSCLPELDVIGSIYGSNIEEGQAGKPFFAPLLMRQPQANYFVGLSLTFPIYNDTALGMLKQRRGQYAQAILNTQLLEEQALSAVRATLSNQLILIGQINTTADEVKAARQLYDNGVVALKVGLLSLFDLLSFENRLTNVLITQNTYRQQYMQNIAQLRFLTSTLFSQRGDPHCIEIQNIADLPDFSTQLQYVNDQNIDQMKECYVR